MLKKITSILLISAMCVLPAGCAGNYKSYQTNLAKKELYLQNAKKESMRYAMKALENIVNSFEQEAYKEAENGNLVTDLQTIATGETSQSVAVLVMYMIKKDEAQMRIEIARVKREVIREFAPIFQNICDQMIEAGNPPKTWEDVATAFIKQIPMMAAMGAMWKLSDAAIANAGSTINATLDNGSNLNLAQDGSSVTQSTEIAAEAAEATEEAVVEGE